MMMARTALMAVLFAGLSTAFFGSTSYAQTPACGSGGSPTQLEMVILTSDQQLFCYRERITIARNMGPIVGVQMGEQFVGIDFRPANGVLYGITNMANVYSLVESNGSVTAQLTGTLNDVMGGAPVALNGTSFGVDFNPVPDRLRVTSDTGQNLRINVIGGATNVDGGINNGMGMTVLNATAAAYLNNDNDAVTGTTLYTVNTDGNNLNVQAPPNAGTQNAAGGLRVDANQATAFDIFSTNSASGMTTTTSANRALALLQTGTGMTTATNLYEVNLQTGAATLIPPSAASPNTPLTSTFTLIGLAIPLQQGM